MPHRPLELAADFFGRLAADKLKGKFLATLADDRKKQARRLTIDFICNKIEGLAIRLGRGGHTLPSVFFAA